ncbi:hypothetical protein BBO99_00006307 [Phytophthora kernoviae]|uniref:Uncharacterized protein n=2 Tax=Phytophthora kernoviae TaxID=325452 RepID=A0A3R7GQ40_9STRA|nr:hypothetical protein G195_009714 [Phytophthora kernoviae 00238/432]KAG2511673.1 hypothetical protein JM16_006167 [Phytophthora kernoviae]KAG2515781.1 hypothetical protein JM18_008124 [Phytophthora kernoviae]RLN27035.1 hypothetical protein BBI17_006440 [Phytophthora kernoviae]RLN77997.1 hypothetical protein BBO99_00006307 [Phytophthora kernoviae]
MMQHYLQRLQLADVVDSNSPRALSVVHVAGTKGKGSTCAMVERILRQAGYKTGLFTSPHLVTPCERFRINGKPIADDVFLRHFNAVWDGLEQTQDQSGPYPPMAWFFRFLTLMALHLFVDEQVDVVILEVGLGGRLDATNVFRKPVVCGVSTLDLDHTRVLGETLDLIAYAKAGIFKPGVPSFTTAQEPIAMEMLEKCASETGTPLASTRATPMDKRVLIFTIHHERNVAQLFAPLLKQHFDRVYFCPTISSRPSMAKVHTFSEALEIAGFQDVVSKYSSEQLAVLDDVEKEAHPWQTTLSRIWSGLKTHVVGEDQSSCIVAVKDSVVDCINELRRLSEDVEVSLLEKETTNDEQWDENWSVLVTGSLYLAGEALDFLGWQE